MAYDLLPALRLRQWRFTICVRVSRKWEYRGGTDDGPIQHVDLVLVNEKGNNMYGEIPGPQVEVKSPLIEEGGIYVISRFKVSNAKSAYRPVACRYMVEFTLHTTISAPMADMPDFPKYAYKITPISDLPNCAGDTRDFADTIGVLVQKSDAYTVHLANKPAPTLTRHIVLRDLRYSEMKVTLWGERAAAFNIDGVDGATEEKPIIVLFVGGLMKSYQGTYYLSANTASRWYFNPDILEARLFYDSYQNQKIQVRTIAAPLDQEGDREPPAPLEEKTLQELNAMDPYDFSANGYRCSVTIARLVPDVSWWFPSCNRCSRSCVVDGSGYRCNPCSASAYRFKYKISFVALDSTGEAEMICFGDVARRMIGKSVQQVLRAAPNPNTYPPDITRMVSLRFTFQIALTQQSYYRQQKTYQVVSVVTTHGQQDAIPHLPVNEGGAGANTPESTQSLSGLTDTRSGLATPSSVTNGATPSMLSTSSPPLSVDIHDTPGPENQTGTKSARGSRSSARKRLTYASDDELDQSKLTGKDSQEEDPTTKTFSDGAAHIVTKSGVAAKGRGAEPKRSRAPSLPQESG